jgi:hypothetical protein
MIARHTLAVAAVLAAVSIGCQSSRKNSSPEASAAPPAAPPVQPAGGTPSELTTASALANKSEWYTRHLGPLLEQRAVPAASQVEWLGADDVRLAPAAPAQAKVQTTPEPQTPPTALTPQPTPDPTEAAAAPPARSPAGPVMASVQQPIVRPLVLPADPNSLEQRLLQRTIDNPTDAAAHLEYQVHRFVTDEPVPDLTSLAGLPTEDREIVSALMDGLSTFRSGLRADGNMLSAQKVRPLLEMADRIRGQADLSVPRAALCSEVRQFGVYKEIMPARFAAGRVHDVILYCEVANFASQQNADAMWETRLSYEAVLYTEAEQGLPVDQHKPQVVPDQSRTRRHDFFLVDKIRLPANLTIGRYLLKVTIIDQLSNRIAETTVPLQIVAK